MIKLKYLLHRLKWHLAPYLNFKSLIHLDLELNNNCNQKCVMCWHSGEVQFEKAKMNFVDARRIMQEAYNLGARSIKFNWRGEPTLCSYLPLAIWQAKQIGYSDVMINTNGIMTAKKLDSIIKAGIDTIIVSVDSLIKENYCKIHGVDQFEQMHKTIARLIRKKRRGLKTRVKFNFHINKINRHEDLYMYKNYLKTFGIEGVIRNTEKREGKNISIVGKRKRKKRCPHMYRRLTVSASGNVYPCCVAYRESSSMKLGTCIDQELCGITISGDKLRKSMFCREIFKKMYKEKRTALLECKNCPSGDIYYRSYNEKI